MIKVFLTGDNHFGRKYERYPDVKNMLIESRFISFKKAVDCANSFGADFFVVSGDLFDRASGITRELTSRVVGLLSAFEGITLVLPGNHDYYSGEEQVWKYFDEDAARLGADILLLSEYKPYEFDIREEKVVFYPACCRSKHGDENNLGWIKKLKLGEVDAYRIGIAHGAIEGVTPDKQKEYFLMSEDELKGLKMDAWLIGHTHIPYPPTLSEEEFTEAGRIFNAGTHEQTDLSTNTEGYCFALEIEKTGDISKIRAKKVRTGQVKFEDIRLEVGSSDAKGSLEKSLRELKDKITENSVVRATITGAISVREYENRKQLYEKCFKKALTYEVADDGLRELITGSMIKREFAETSFAARLLEELMDEPREAQMVYDLIKAGEREG